MADRANSFIHLPMWAGFQAGPDDEPSSGEIELSYEGETMTAAQQAAHETVVVLATALQAVLLEGIVREYPTFRKMRPRPASITTGDLRSLIRLRKIIVLGEEHANVAYLGYLFKCAWDSSLCAATHVERFVAAGYWDVIRHPIPDPALSKPKVTPPSTKAVRAAEAVAQKAAASNPARLTLTDGHLEVTLPVWAGFRAGNRGAPSEGRVTVRVQAADGGDVTNDAEITAEQQAAYRCLMDRAKAIQRSVFDAIIAHYEEVRSDYDDLLEFDLPPTVDDADLRGLIELDTIHLHAVQAKGVAYTGYSFTCLWEQEHDLGVMAHGGRVVEVGHAEVSFETGTAEQDSASPLALDDPLDDEADETAEPPAQPTSEPRPIVAAATTLPKLGATTGTLSPQRVFVSPSGDAGRTEEPPAPLPLEDKREKIRQIFARKGFQGETLEKVIDTVTSDEKIRLSAEMTELIRRLNGVSDDAVRPEVMLCALAWAVRTRALHDAVKARSTEGSDPQLSDTPPGPGVHAGSGPASLPSPLQVYVDAMRVHQLTTDDLRMPADAFDALLAALGESATSLVLSTSVALRNGLAATLLRTRSHIVKVAPSRADADAALQATVEMLQPILGPALLAAGSDEVLPLLQLLLHEIVQDAVAAGDRRAEASMCSSLGKVLFVSEDFYGIPPAWSAQEFLARAVTIAEELQLPEIDRYREELAEAESRLKELRSPPEHR